MKNASFTNTTATFVGECGSKSQKNDYLSLFEKAQAIIDAHWAAEPELYRMVQLQKQQASNDNQVNAPSDDTTPENTIATEPKPWSFFSGELRGAELRQQIQASQATIRDYKSTLNADIFSRTQASNKKCPDHSVDDEINFRSDIVLEQIQAWRNLIPTFIRQFSKIKDPRNTKSIKHKLTVLILFGLFTFVFCLSSRREMNRELTAPVLFEHLQKIFPEIDSIPHADTLARLLERIDPKSIEAVHISLIRDLIKKKKFKKLLINGCLPVTIDGVQKLYRAGLLQDFIINTIKAVAGNDQLTAER